MTENGDGHHHPHHHENGAHAPDFSELVRIGVGGPVGSGKSHLVLRLCEALRDGVSMIVITNDIYTREDAQFLTEKGALAPGRIMGVETGGCPHAAIRDDISLNLDALQLLYARHEDARLALIESGGDNLSATFSPELVDFQIYVIDVAQGDDIPRKGGLGIGRSDLLVVNKMDLAPYVGADLKRMRSDLAAARGPLPTFFTNLRACEGIEPVVSWVRAAMSMDRDSRAHEPLWRGAHTLASAVLKEHRHGE